MRKIYDELKLRVVWLDMQDVITSSLQPNPEENETEPDFLG